MYGIMTSGLVYKGILLQKSPHGLQFNIPNTEVTRSTEFKKVTHYAIHRDNIYYFRQNSN